MTVRELREKYLAFFESKGHLLYPAASLIPYDATGRLDESLMFTGAGMVQFKPFFRGVAKPDNVRLMTCQRCVRTGDIDEVGDPNHLTFFEMFGNFSFGDYFKAQAIAFSWEFMTSPQWLGLDPKRLTFTVFEEDDEAYNEWAFWITPTGMNPEHRIFRLGDETNYWPAGSFTKGPPGPCGPNSEMFYWVADEEPPTGVYTREDWIRDDAAGKWLEIWNDVFIQFEWQGRLRNPDRPADGYEKEGMPPLPFQSIDTGMGLERTATALSGLKSCYDTDAFQPIFDQINKLRGRTDASPEEVRAMRIVADHIRTSAFCIMDGILPANNGRGYVLRRLIRRAVLKGQRVLGFEQPFFHTVYEGVVQAMGSFYTELVEKREVIVETLKNEEALFRRTLANGIRQLEEQITALELQGKTGYSGTAAFLLYDTFGFPLEVTQEVLSERGMTVDVDAYEVALKEAQDRSRGAQDRESVYGGVTGADELAVPDAPETTRFTGYDCVEDEGRIVRIRLSGDGLLVALDQTPFYAESGGQTGDHGKLALDDGTYLDVTNTTKSAGTFWHHIPKSPNRTPDVLLGKHVIAQAAGSRRSRIRRNHTATHLLQAALRSVLGNHVTQAGSYVGPENLRFDFTHGKALSPDELARIERIVNEQVLENTPVQTHVDLPIAEAKARGAMALFGEKYGDKVRMVEVGEFSRELCGGTHVRSTGEIGLFKITSEASAASGVRRIEAITGEAAYEWALDQTNTIKRASEIAKANPRELVQAVERLQEQLKEERRKRERAEMASMKGPSSQDAEQNIELAAGIKLWVRNFGEVDQKIAAQALDNAAAQDPNFVGLVAVATEGRVNFLAKAGKEAVAKGAHCGNLVREVAKIAGGGGGGRPDFATAGGKDASKADQALQSAAALLGAMLSVSPD
jgi:alanyl-tRNA synthetase